MKITANIRVCALPLRLDRGEGRAEVSNFAHILRFPSALLHFLIARWRRPIPLPAPPRVQLALDLDQLTASGLRLHEAIPVRSAEYWLQLGKPDLALQELQTLPEPVRQHHWSRRVRFAACLQLLNPRRA